jgi:hypothetical protein
MSKGRGRDREEEERKERTVKEERGGSWKGRRKS